MMSTRFVSVAAVRGARIAAILLLGLLALDLGDAACDPLRPASRSGVASAPADHADPCSDICMDDCFCCSSSVPAIRPSPVAEPSRIELVKTLHGGEASTGFALTPDHVPLPAV